MKRRGFTLAELLIASSISLLILMALCVALSGVWREAVKTNEEMQVMLKASSMREKLLVGTANAGEKGFHGLLNVTTRVAALESGKTLCVYGRDGKEDSDESLPGRDSIFTFGKSKANGTKSVTVTNIAENVENSYGYKETQQRVLVYLWVETPTGTACRMPVYVTVVKEEEEGS